MTTILVRLFNDFEVVKLCALYGLPDQASGPLRDTIECMMLVRLFTLDARAATRWLTHGNEYAPGSVYADLATRGIAAPEYAQYGFLSDRTHPNLFGSLATAKETDHGRGNIEIKWGLGGYDSPFFIRSALYHRCVFQLLALTDPLGKLFGNHFGDSDWIFWRSQIRIGTNNVGALELEPDAGVAADTSGVKVAIAKMDKKQERTEAKLLKEMRKLFGPGFNLE